MKKHHHSSLAYPTLKGGDCAAHPFPNSIQSNLWKLMLIRMFFWMHFFSAVLVPFFTEWGGLTLSQVLGLNAWFMLWNFFLEVPTGTVADYLGRKVSLALGSLVGLVAALVYVSKPSFAVFLLAEIIFAAAYTLHSGADEALAYDTLKSMGHTDQAKKIISRMESFKLGGIIIGALLGGFIAAKWGLSSPLRAYVFPALMAFILSLTLVEPAVHSDRQSRLGYMAILKEGGRYFLQHRLLLLLTAEVAITHALAWGLIWLFQPLLQRAGFPIASFGLIHAASCAGQIFFLSQVPWMEKKLGSKRRLLVGGCVVTGIAFMLLGFVRSPFLVAFTIILAFSFGLTRIPLFSAYMNQHIGSAQRATVLSFSSMVRTLSIVIVNPIIGFLADWSLPSTMVILGTALILIAFFSRIEEVHLLESPAENL